MDNIHIQGIEAEVHIGVSPQERAFPQPLKLSLTLGTSFTAAVLWDDLTKTIDYAEISKFVIHFIETSHFNLLETLAEKLSESLFLTFSIETLKLVIDKPKALAPKMGVPGIEIYRERGGQ